MLNKLLLAMIAFGLWTNAAILLMRPAAAQAGAFVQIADDLHALVHGGVDCLNTKLCD